MKEQTPGGQPPEGQQREALARYFLSSPPYAALSAAERVDFRRRLRQLGALEDQEVIAAAGCCPAAGTRRSNAPAAGHADPRPSGWLQAPGSHC